MQSSRRDGLKAIVIALAGAMVFIGLIYTGIHNYNLFQRALPPDQQIFALIPVILLEGGIALFIIGSFVWFSIGAQKVLSAAFSWILFGIVTFNTLVDSTINTNAALPDWLTLYATLMLPITPVLVVAMWKIIIDTDPSKRRMDMQKTIEAARIEAMYQAAQRALTGDATRSALIDYGRTYEDAMARNIRDSAPAIPPPAPTQRANGHRPDTTTLHADAPPTPKLSSQRPKASKATNGDAPAQDGHSGA
jgi:hypothetical protein